MVLSGPSGVGKDSVLRELKSQDHKWRFTVTVTTRSQRPGEEDGVDYFFLDRDTFHPEGGGWGLPGMRPGLRQLVRSAQRPGIGRPGERYGRDHQGGRPGRRHHQGRRPGRHTHIPDAPIHR